MMVEQVSDETSQLAEKHHLGAPLKTYCTDKRSDLKIMGWMIGILTLVMLVMALSFSRFQFTSFNLFLDGLFVAIPLVVGLILMAIVLLARRMTIYVYASGLLVHSGKTYQVARWEEIEWVTGNHEKGVIYLANQETIEIGSRIPRLVVLIQEIELKAQLARDGEEGDIEQRFEDLLIRRGILQQEKIQAASDKQELILHERPEEVEQLGAEYRLGEHIATYHAGFKGVLRRKILAVPIYYTLLLIWAVLIVGPIIGIILFLGRSIFNLDFLPDVSFLRSYWYLIYMLVLFISGIYMPRYFARFTRLHLYSQGLIYIEVGEFEVVSWEQIERIVSHKTLPMLSPHLCHMYLTKGDAVIVSGYVHQQAEIKTILDEHVEDRVKVGYG